MLPNINRHILNYCLKRLNIVITKCEEFDEEDLTQKLLNKDREN